MRSPHKEWLLLLLDICKELSGISSYSNRSIDLLYRSALRFQFFMIFREIKKEREQDLRCLFLSEEEYGHIPRFEKLYIDLRDLICANCSLPADLYSEAIRYELYREKDGSLSLHKTKSRRKSGVYYTPKVIVDYIIRETLKPLVKNKTSKEILKTRICDPAMGAGKFLTAAADFLKSECLGRSNRKDRDYNKELYRKIVRNCIFGMDNDPFAVALTKAFFIVSTDLKSTDLKNIIQADTLLDDLPDSKDFDAVIGNPPWMTFGLRDVRKIDPGLNRILRRKFPATAEYKISVYALFVEKAVQMTKEGGFHSFIVPDSWLSGRYFFKLRKFILNNTVILRLVLVSSDFWQGLSIGRSMIYIIQNTKFDSRKSIQGTIIGSPEELKKTGNRSVEISVSRILNRNRCRIYLYRDKTEKRIIEKMEGCGDTLGRHVRFYSGLIGKRGRDSVIINNVSPDSCFTERGMLIESGRNLERDKLMFTGNYISHDPSLYKSGYNTNRYLQPKIFLNQTGDKLKAFYDEKGFFCLNNLHIGNKIDEGTDLRFIAFLLNSRVMNYYYKTASMEHGRALAQTDIDFLHDLPYCTDSTIPKDIINILDSHLKYESRIVSSNYIEYRLKIPDNHKRLIEDMLCEWYGVEIPVDFRN
ncbi:Eco57I restriction-modification methylase domain-containing protein [candidate division KSB1 bacterium]